MRRVLKNSKGIKIGKVKVGKIKRTPYKRVKIKRIGGVKMECTELVANHNAIILDGKRIDEFMEKSKNGAMKKMMAKLELAESKRKTR